MLLSNMQVIRDDRIVIEVKKKKKKKVRSLNVKMMQKVYVFGKKKRVKS